MTKISDLLSTALSQEVSFFANVWTKEPAAAVMLADYLAGIKSGRWAAEVEECRRALDRGDERGYTQVKRKLGSVTVSCRMASRAEGAEVRVIQHSGMLQADFDMADNPQLGAVEAVVDMRKALAADPHVAAVFCGPSARGLKAIVRIDGSRHRESALSAARYFLERYGLKADAACKDVERLCFVSHDPLAWWRSEAAAVLPITDIREEPAAGGAAPQDSEWLAEDVREVLAVIPPRPDYDTWLRIASGVFNTLPFEEAVTLLKEWSPEEQVGEYSGKWKSRLKEVSIRTVIYEAQKHGFDAAAAARRKRWMGRLVFSGGQERGAGGHAELLDARSEPSEGELLLETWNALQEEQNGDARLFERIHGQDYRYDVEKALWRRWDAAAGLWRIDAAGTTVLHFSESLAAEYLNLAGTIEEEIRRKSDDPKDKRREECKALERRAKQLRRRDWSNGSLDRAQKLPGLVAHANDFDARRGLLAVANGVIDFDAGCFRSAQRGDMLSVSSPAAFVENAACPHFDDFLRTVFAADEDLIAFWWRVVGYCLTGYVDHDALFFFYGKGANGKSTAIMTLRMLLGDALSTMVSVDTLIGGGQMESSSNTDYKKAMLEGRRVVFTDEIPENRRFNEATIKQIVSGEDIVARRPYEKAYSFAPTHKVIAVGNHKPKITGTDHGIWRRLHLVPFTVTIPEAKRRHRHAMLAEFRGELSGILWRAVQGWMDSRGRGGLDVPQAVINATSEYKAEEDQIGSFLADCTEESIVDRASTKGLFKAYQAWCVEQNEFLVAKTLKGFTMKLGETGLVIAKDRTRASYVDGRRLVGDVGKDSGSFI